MVRTRRPLLKLFIALCVAGLAALAFLDARIVSTFSDRMWELPAKVYARPMELFVGARLRPADLVYELELLGYRQSASVSAPGQFSGRGGDFTLHTRGFTFADEREPARRVALSITDGRVATLESAGSPVALMRLDPVQIGGIYPRHGEDRLLVRLEEVPESLIGGLLAVEDQKFYDHWGFSFTGIARAAFSNLRSGQVVAGGSTITQQLIKNYYLTPERTISRKLMELVMAVLLDARYDKGEILESYLNEVYLGQDGPRAIHGFGLAARHYFDTPLEQLGLHQQALLVGMIKGPSLYNPLRNPGRAKERRDLVLDVMAAEGVVSEERAVIAKAMPLGLNSASRTQKRFPAYLDLVRRQLREEYREEDLATKGLQIFTNFDPILQHQLEESSSALLEQIDPGGELETASVVTNVDTGEIVALVGGRSMRYAGFNRALDARRPAGSLIKPAVYLTALEQSRYYTLATPLDDSALRHELPTGQLWEPENFDHEIHEGVLLHEGLANSYNQATARLGLELGIDSVVALLRRLGVDGDIPAVPALTLGAGEYAPIHMARMYQTIAAGGFTTPLRSIRDILDPQGQALTRYPLAYERAVDLRVMHLLHYALREVVREGTGRGVYRYLPADFHVAGKTGTTNDGRDSWFAGFSGDLMAVSWVGRDDNGSTGLTGASGALRIWADFMAAAARRPLGYEMPDGIELHWIDDDSGLRAGPACANARQLPFIAATEPERRADCVQVKGRIRGWFERLFGDDG